MVKAHSLKQNTSERISELKYRFQEIPQNGTPRGRYKKGKVKRQSRKNANFQQNYNSNYRGEKRKNHVETIFEEILAKNIPELM